MSSLDRQINLLPQQEFHDSRRERRSRFLYIGLLFLLLILAFGAIGIWSTAFVLAREIQTAEEQASSLQKTIASLSDREQKVQLLVNRLKTAHSVISARPDFEKELRQIISIFPQDVSILSADFDKNGKTVDFKVGSNTYSGLNNSISALQNGKFPQTVIKQLTRDHRGIYSVEVLLTLP